MERYQRLKSQFTGTRCAMDGAAAPAVSAVTSPSAFLSTNATSAGVVSTDPMLVSSRQQKMLKLGSKGFEGTRKMGAVITAVYRHELTHMKDWISDIHYRDNSYVRTRTAMPRTAEATAAPSPDTTCRQGPYQQVVREDECSLMDVVRKDANGESASTVAHAFVRAGPRAHIAWEQGEVKAAIVTCGGLCPGLNDVICEITNTLYYNYGVDEIYGIKSGYRGFLTPVDKWERLTPASILGITELGGTVLGSSRGGFDADGIVSQCVKKGVNHIYVIGGDGSHRAAEKIHLTVVKKNVKMVVACVPKTIDNDIGIIDRSFGFNTAVSHAVVAIRSAVTEARAIPNGVGIVKLMGREAGFIAAHATLSSRMVDLCLIPEVNFSLNGPTGILNYISRAVKNQGYAVIVVAEGAGGEYLKSQGKDESGNK